MATRSIAPVDDKYVLPTGKDDAARLDLIHEVYGPISRKALATADIQSAARAADVGCGTGTVSRWMASQMDRSGRVDAIDIAPGQIEVARSTAAAPDSASVQYQLGSAYSPGLPQGAFNIVFCRLLLCHLKKPGRAVTEMARLLRPGGRLVLVDLDMRDTFTMPPCESYARIIDEAILPYGAKVGTDCSVGLRLPQLSMAAAAPRSDRYSPLRRNGNGPGIACHARLTYRSPEARSYAHRLPVDPRRHARRPSCGSGR